VSYGESQGVTLSSDESDHAECKTLGIILIACDNDLTDVLKRSQARVCQILAMNEAIG
jgi:hypothetical protein